jgi:hypothetical protein
MEPTDVLPDTADEEIVFDRPGGDPAAGDDSATVEAPSRFRLSNHASLSGTTAHGLGASLFGLIFVAAGTFVVLLGLRVIPAPDSSFNVPPPMVAACGLVFLVPGLIFVFHGIRGWLRQRRYDAHAALNPGAPWAYEHPWQREGESRTGWRKVGKSLYGLGLFGLMLGPFNWVVFGNDDVPGMFRFVFGFFDLIWVGMIVAWLRSVAQAIKYGTSTVSYATFPYFTGGRVDLRFGLSSKHAFHSMTFTLRAVEEVYEVRKHGNKRTETVVCYGLHEETRTVNAPHEMPEPGRDVWIKFEAPSNVPGSDLNARPPTYWEIEIRCDAPGVDYKEIFLLPVYSQSRGGGQSRAAFGR